MLTITRERKQNERIIHNGNDLCNGYYFSFNKQEEGISRNE